MLFLQKAKTPRLLLFDCFMLLFCLLAFGEEEHAEAEDEEPEEAGVAAQNIIRRSM